jgi:uncharacterized protein YycO
MRRSLIFTRAAHPLRDLPIRAFEGGEAGHVGIRVGDEVTHSAWMQGGVLRHDVPTFLAGRVIVAEVPLTLPNPEAADTWLAQQVLKPYDLTALLGFLMWRDWSHDDKWYCSELAAAYMLEGGATLAGRHRRIGVRLLHEVAYARSMGRLGAV